MGNSSHPVPPYTEGIGSKVSKRIRGGAGWLKNAFIRLGKGSGRLLKKVGEKIKKGSVNFYRTYVHFDPQNYGPENLLDPSSFVDEKTYEAYEKWLKGEEAPEDMLLVISGILYNAGRIVEAVAGKETDYSKELVEKALNYRKIAETAKEIKKKKEAEKSGYDKLIERSVDELENIFIDYQGVGNLRMYVGYLKDLARNLGLKDDEKRKLERLLEKSVKTGDIYRFLDTLKEKLLSLEEAGKKRQAYEQIRGLIEKEYKELLDVVGRNIEAAQQTKQYLLPSLLDLQRELRKSQQSYRRDLEKIWKEASKKKKETTESVKAAIKQGYKDLESVIYGPGAWELADIKNETYATLGGLGVAGLTALLVPPVAPLAWLLFGGYAALNLAGGLYARFTGKVPVKKEDGSYEWVKVQEPEGFNLFKKPLKAAVYATELKRLKNTARAVKSYLEQNYSDIVAP